MEFKEHNNTTKNYKKLSDFDTYKGLGVYYGEGESIRKENWSYIPQPNKAKKEGVLSCTELICKIQ